MAIIRDHLAHIGYSRTKGNQKAMQDYFSVAEISAEIGVSDKVIYKHAKLLGIDTSKITEDEKERLIEACSKTIARKTEAQEFISGAKVDETDMISLQSESTLEKRLYIAKNEFNHITKSLADCQMAIDKKGTIILNNNGAISSNPAVKTKCELLKQQNALQKTISDLEQALKMSVPSQESAIDD